MLPGGDQTLAASRTPNTPGEFPVGGGRKTSAQPHLAKLSALPAVPDTPGPGALPRTSGSLLPLSSYKSYPRVRIHLKLLKHNLGKCIHKTANQETVDSIHSSRC